MSYAACRVKRTLVWAFVAVPLLAIPAWADSVSVDRVRQVTQGFLRTRAAQRPQGPGTLSASGEKRSASILAADTPRAIRADDGTLLAYVTELKPRGYVVTAADTQISPIVAYSLRSPFPVETDGMHPLSRLLKEDLLQRVVALRGSDSAAAAKNLARWNRYASGSGQDDEVFQQWPAPGATSTGGWLETTWHQDEPFNAFCPLDPVDGLRSYVGCVATAMAQVVHYHRRAGASFNAVDAYTTPAGIDVDADGDRYDFPSFAELNDALTEVRFKYLMGSDLDDTDMAALSAACGFATLMDYSSEGSGAYTVNLQAALLEKFGFHSADLVGGLSREFLAVLHENLANQLPVIFGIGYPVDGGGHIIVCDGFNTDGQYHLNFGWGAPYPDDITEAWYHLPVGVPTSFNTIQEVLLDICPAAPGIEVDPRSLYFDAAPGEESPPQMLFLESRSTAFSQIESVSCPAAFVASLGGEEYADYISSFAMPVPGQDLAIRVKFCPSAAGAYTGTLTINYGDGLVRNVMLTGYALDGGTQVQAGGVSGTWSFAESPYYILGDIHVQTGGALTIEPGVRVLFAGGYSLTVGPGAMLRAKGTADAPIELTAGNPEEGWRGVRFVESDDDDRLRHCVITGCRKGGSEVNAAGPDPDAWGGAVYCDQSHPTIDHCRIANNRGDCAGAIYGRDSDVTIENTVIANNASIGAFPQVGGICAVGNSDLKITNCTVVNNFPGGILSASSYWTEVRNTIVWGNGNYQMDIDDLLGEVTYCDIQGGHAGEANVDADPCFFDPSRGIGAEYDGATANWTLRSDSPCINGGMPDAPGQTDLAGYARVYSGLADLGAYESQLDLPLLTVTPAGTFDLGCTRINEEATTSLELSNTGQVEILIESVSLVDPNGVFSIGSPPFGHVLPPGDSVEVEVSFTPLEEGICTASLQVKSNSRNAPLKRIPLRGTGITGTIVEGGSVSGVWEKAQSPYVVTGDIAVPRGRSLTIEPGVEVRFAGHYGLTVGYRATLSAVGSEAEPVVFTAVDTDEGWFGIRFLNTSDDDVLRYCTVEYARKPKTEMTDYPNAMGGGIFCGMVTDFTAGMPMASSPTIDHCLIVHNRAYYAGGIMCMDGSEAVITHNRIMDNSGVVAGGIWVYAAYPRIANNVIAHNSASAGGGIYNFYGIPTIINNTIVHNRPNALDLDWANWIGFERVPILNNIIWGNEIHLWPDGLPGEYDIRFNDIQGGWSGQGNIEAVPEFADPENRDYHLKSEAGRWDVEAASWVSDELTSPCIDAGDPGQSTGDESGSHGDTINLGAYGGTAQASRSPGS